MAGTREGEYPLHRSYLPCRSVTSSRRSSGCEGPACHSVRMRSSAGQAAPRSSSTIRRVTRSSCFSPDA